MPDSEQSSEALASTLRVAALALPAPGFENFTFPRYRPLLLGTERPETTQERVAVGAWLGDMPAGLAFFSLPFGDDKTRRLLSITVSPLMRRQHLGTRLLAMGEEQVRALGAQKLTATHSSRMAGIAAYEALLRKAGWGPPSELEYRLAGKASWSLQALVDWAPFLARLRDRGFGVIAWTDMTDADRKLVEKIVANDLSEAEREFDPFKLEKNPESAMLPGLSVLLRLNGEIVGWILGSRGIVADTYHYSSGYVLPSVRRAGWLIGGVREVCQRQVELFGGETLSVFETSPHNQGMRRFMDRQLKPYSVWTDARFVSEKNLTLAGE